MIVVEHNNETSGLPIGEPRSSNIVTLRDVIGVINASESIPASQKRYMRSALNRANVLLANGHADVRADPKDILRRLDQMSQAAADMTSQSWANLKSRIRCALRHAAPYLAPAHSRIRLEREWAALAAAAPRRERCHLSRLFRFAQDKGLQPDDIGEPQVEQFYDHLEHQAIHSDSVHVVRTTRRAWNRCVDTVPGWPQRRLEAPARRGAPYYRRPEQLPESLQQEMDEYLHRLQHPDPFLGPGGKTLAPTTIHQFRLTFITLASALVAAGMPVDKLSSIATLVQPDNLERALRFLYARAGHRVYHFMFRVVLRARTIGGQVGLSEQDLARIDRIVASVKREQSAEYGLTPKNRRLLAHLDDPALVDRLLTFPQRVVEAAKSATNKRHAATRARDAVAIELLLMCGMRLGNLARLRVGETIRKVGEARDAYWVVDLRKLDTTRTYYALEQTRVATERYHQVIERKGAKALSRSRSKRRRKGSVR